MSDPSGSSPDAGDDGTEASDTARGERWTNPTITGTAVVLRPITVQDTDAMLELVQDPEGNDLTATTETFDRATIEQWCASRQRQDGRIDLAVVERATGEYAGEVVLNEYDAAHNSANFRIALRGPAWYGRGLGTEATRLVVAHGFDVVGLDRITLEVLARNPRARRAYTTAGFREVDSHDADGETWVRMAITR